MTGPQKLPVWSEQGQGAGYIPFARFPNFSSSDVWFYIVAPSLPSFLRSAVLWYPVPEAQS